MSSTAPRAANLSPPRGTPGGDALVLTRVFDAPPELVFSLWAEPEYVKQWWRPDGFTTPVYEMDFRVGGAYRYRIVAAGKDNWARGEYREIDPPRRLVMTFRWDSGDPSNDRETVITVTFAAESSGGTLMTFRQAPFDSDDARHRNGVGWGQVLDAFARFLATRSST